MPAPPNTLLRAALFVAVHQVVHTGTYTVPCALRGALRCYVCCCVALVRLVWSYAASAGVVPPQVERRVSAIASQSLQRATALLPFTAAAETMVRVVAASDAAAGDSLARRFGFAATGFTNATNKRGEMMGVTFDFPYTAPLYNEHIATILPSAKTVFATLGCSHESCGIAYRPQRITSADGCELLLDWAFRRDHPQMTSSTNNALPPAALIAIVPGLASDSHSAYIMSFAAQAMMAGYDVVVLNSRGMKATESRLTRPKAISGAFTDDVRHVVYNELTRETIIERCGVAVPLVLVGFSLGANVLCKFLSEDRDRVAQLSCVVMAAAVSAPWRFVDSCRHMSRPAQMAIYQGQLTGGLTRYLANNEDQLRDADSGKGVGVSAWDWDRALAVKTVHDFDDAVVVPHHGYDSRDAYYADASCWPRMGTIRTPLLCVATADDVITGPPPTLDEWRALIDTPVAGLKSDDDGDDGDEDEEADTKTASPPPICYALMPAGGHLGFLQDPAAERRGDANPAEAVVLRAVTNFLATTRRW